MFVVSESKMNKVLDALEDCVRELRDANYLKLVIPFDRSSAQKQLLAYIATLAPGDYAVGALMEGCAFISGFGTGDEVQMPNNPRKISS